MVLAIFWIWLPMPVSTRRSGPKILTATGAVDAAEHVVDAVGQRAGDDAERAGHGARALADVVETTSAVLRELTPVLKSMSNSSVGHRA